MSKTPESPGASRAPVLHLARALTIIALGASTQGCAVVAVADAAVSVAATVVKTTVKATGAVVDAVIPDGDDKKKD